jgi:urease accessory protein
VLRGRCWPTSEIFTAACEEIALMARIRDGYVGLNACCMVIRMQRARMRQAAIRFRARRLIMMHLTAILGHAGEPYLAERLHELAHGGRVEYLHLAPQDSARRRFRQSTDAGTDCGIALHRDERLFDGAVLHLDAERAIVVRLGEETWLRLRPRDEAAALELGYFAGNMHWRVRFDQGTLLVAMTAPRGDYLARLSELLAKGGVEALDD